MNMEQRKKYEVEGVYDLIDPMILEFAFDLQYNYRLPFDIHRIAHDWQRFSEDLCASWMRPNKKDVEAVFGVKLKERKENGT